MICRPKILSVTNGAAVMPLDISEKIARQCGRYRFGCIERICQATKYAMADVTARMFLIKPAREERRVAYLEQAQTAVKL
ncbi:MAG: hypothetical protein O6840_03220 [Nitrospirae bacterium]|nr:hypothetical protein [Nitrospirota bacterium]